MLLVIHNGPHAFLRHCLSAHLHSSAFLGFRPQVIGASLDTRLLFLPTGTILTSGRCPTTESWDQAAIMLVFLAGSPAPNFYPCTVCPPHRSQRSPFRNTSRMTPFLSQLRSPKSETPGKIIRELISIGLLGM